MFRIDFMKTKTFLLLLAFHGLVGVALHKFTPEKPAKVKPEKHAKVKPEKHAKLITFKKPIQK